MNTKVHPTLLSNMLINNFGHVVNNLLDENVKNANHSLCPPLELNEYENHYTLLLSMPGIDKKDIEISQEDHILKVIGQKESAQDELKKLHSEFRYGKYFRRIRLPKNANLEQISAKMKNGILYVEVSKREDSKPKNIEIK